MHPLRLGTNLLLAAAIGLGAGLLVNRCAEAQGRRNDDRLPTNGVTCRHVPNGVYVTLVCSNGYWRTIGPEGQELVGNGIVDPNQSAVGGNFVINPATGGPNINPGAGPIVRPPYQAPSTAPGQAESFGGQPRYD